MVVSTDLKKQMFARSSIRYVEKAAAAAHRSRKSTNLAFKASIFARAISSCTNLLVQRLKPVSYFETSRIAAGTGTPPEGSNSGSADSDLYAYKFYMHGAP